MNTIHVIGNKFRDFESVISKADGSEQIICYVDHSSEQESDLAKLLKRFIGVVSHEFFKVIVDTRDSSEFFATVKRLEPKPGAFSDVNLVSITENSKGKYVDHQSLPEPDLEVTWEQSAV